MTTSMETHGMGKMGDFELQVALSKTGVELFRELLRIYPVAELEDYYWNGWRTEAMKVDLQLVAHHRLEAGAADPIPLDKVQLPQLPASAYAAAATPATRPQALFQGVTGLRLVAGAAAPGGTAPSVSGGAELRLMALFVAKWKLDPSRTKLMLAKLEPPQRRFIIQNFKAVTSAGTPAVTDELEKFITESREKETWPKDGAPAAAAVPRPAAGVKRPAEAASAEPANKAAKVATAAAQPASAAVAAKAGATITKKVTPAAAGGAAQKAGASAKAAATAVVKAKIITGKPAGGAIIKPPN